MSAKRIGISKGTRFRIFARDNFTCRYCGSQADTVTLVVDHLIPVKIGGTNDDENLITACEPCNQGKAAKSLDQAAPNDMDRLRLAQERREQTQAAENARAISEARKDLRQTIVDLWCEERGQQDVHRGTIDCMTSFVNQHGLEIVAEWIGKAHARMPYAPDYRLGKYISGIRRGMIEEGRLVAGARPVPQHVDRSAEIAAQAAQTTRSHAALDAFLRDTPPSRGLTFDALTDAAPVEEELTADEVYAANEARIDDAEFGFEDDHDPTHFALCDPSFGLDLTL